MHYKTKGIVLHQVKYAESSIIVKIYTELFGLKSFIFKGVRKKKSSLKANIFQPLSIVELVLNHKENASIQYVKEIQSVYHFNSIPYDVKKSSIVLFLNELLYKTIREEEANQQLFDFLHQSLLVLDEAKENYSNFHLHFALHLTSYLGFEPTDNYSEENCYFHLSEGLFKNKFLDDTYHIKKPVSEMIFKLASKDFDSGIPMELSQAMRQELLKTLISYYQIHQPSLKEIKAHQVLEEVFG
jgi:DNA repair protein RecO (recombination protein O)